jgi:hypothetical protein
MKKALIAVGVLVLALVPVAVKASPIGELSQLINAGSLSTDIVDAAGATVAAPSFNMTAASVKTTCQTITGSYGDNAQRVNVENPGASATGWSLAIAATGGASAEWTSGGDTYNFNDATGSGCTNGQLTLNPVAATLGLNGGSTSTGVTKGAQASFVSGVTDSLTLMAADASSQDIWSGYLTGIGVSQKVPGYTPAGTYTIDLTQTVTAA